MVAVDMIGVPDQRLFSLNCTRSCAASPNTMPPTRPLPIGSAWLGQSVAACRYQSTRSGSITSLVSTPPASTVPPPEPPDPPASIGELPSTVEASGRVEPPAPPVPIDPAAPPPLVAVAPVAVAEPAVVDVPERSPPVVEVAVGPAPGLSAHAHR